jgi:gamma-aminobutyric acid type B receptor
MKGDWAGLVKEHAHRNISFVGVDAADFQLEYLNKKLVHGLVGQLPHEIGVACFNTLHTHVAWRQASIARSEVEPILLPDRIRTNLVSYNLIPLELPPLAVDENLLGSLAWLGWILFGIVAATALYCIWWTLYYRRVDAIVRAAQPLFLIMIAVGVLILASSLIPLSFDDGGEGGQSHEDSYITTSKESSLSDSFKIGVCMSIPFQAFTGFTMIFSALFAKTWRVNRIVREALSSTNVSQVRASVATERDALFPFAILLSCNWALLLAWTLWDPLTYSRLELEGTDYCM